MKKNVTTALGIILFNGMIAMGNPGITTPTITPSETNEISDPFLFTKGEKILLNLLNSEGHKVVIWVTDENNRVLYREVIKNEVVIEKAFSFEKAYEGRYTVNIRTNNQSFKENITVK